MTWDILLFELKTFLALPHPFTTQAKAEEKKIAMSYSNVSQSCNSLTKSLGKTSKELMFLCNFFSLASMENMVFPFSF